MDIVVVILGPTASGKTDAAIQLAKHMNGEIISADSMQVYKYMDIGTAKPDMNERQGIKHYLIDEITPDTEFSVALYKELAESYIEEILCHNKLPVIVGGTGLYINSLTYNINFSEINSNWEYRDNLRKTAEEKGNEYLHEMLKSVDYEASLKIHPNNVKRVIRALEVFHQTSKTITEHQENSRKEEPKYKYIIFGLRMERNLLYNRINKRVDFMFKKGLVEEVKKLVAEGYDQNTIAMQAIGYKEVLLHLKGEISYEAAVDLVKLNTRHYAKRQMTWFNRLENVNWIDIDDNTDKREILKKMESLLKG